MPKPPEIDVHDRCRQVFRGALTSWYDVERRRLPWRETDDPYRIWLSEVMLQQTRVDQAEPYYHRFVERFPTVHDLASAPLDDVLLCWEGLGYYSRARNLHQAAQMVVDDFGGRVPATEEAIRSLPGVGPYTSAAVLSIAYDRPHAVLDGNVIRVLSRVFAVEADVKRSATRRVLQRAADALIDPAAPGDFNQAMMELGATVCTPRSPRCGDCPVAGACEARKLRMQEAFPVSAVRAEVPHRDVVVALLFDEAGRVLIQRRPEDAMLGGLWEFPGGKREDGESLEAACVRELQEELGIRVCVEDYLHRLSHAYSHFRITLHAFRCRILEGTPTSMSGEPVAFVEVAALKEYAFPRANRRLIEELQQSRREPGLFE